LGNAGAADNALPGPGIDGRDRAGWSESRYV